MLLLLASFFAAAQAESTEIELVTDPPGATLVDQYGNEIGLSGAPFHLDLGSYGSNLELTLRLEGYESKLERIKTRQLKSQKRYPAEGAIALRATSVVVVIQTFCRQNWPLVVLTSLFAVGGCGLALTRRRKVQMRLRRAEQLERWEAQAEELGDPFLGQLLGRFRLTELLGQGGAARVYRGIPDETFDEGEAIAVKVLNPESQDDPEFQMRFKREVSIWKELSHPNIVTFVDWDTQSGVTYLVTELLSKQTLRREFSGNPGGAQDSVVLMKPVFEALIYAHSKGVVHRDLKPENILLTEKGKPKVSDFGLARISVEDKVTKTGTWVGTPEYMSPEQVQGLPLEPRTDQYALGIMLYELATGSPPFTAEDQVAIIFKQVSSQPRPLSELNPELPESYCAVVNRMLAKKADDRFSDLSECFEALEKSLG